MHVMTTLNSRPFRTLRYRYAAWTVALASPRHTSPIVVSTAYSRLPPKPLKMQHSNGITWQDVMLFTFS